MELTRFEQDELQPLEGGANAFYIPVRSGNRTAAMMIFLDKRGDTGKREIPQETMLTVIEGEATVRAGGDVADVKPGDVLIIPAQRQHQIWTVNSQLKAILQSIYKSS
ncbi:MAG: cupin domain-containing protein [Chloroflexi bacterium]|nr:cupin domain-containing protein [Chloroflexota bacterium]